jgi:hypothetical protein
MKSDTPKAADLKLHASRPTHARSRVTNGKVLIPHVDGRSVWVRRLRDLINAHTADLGGEDELTEAHRSVIRRAATIEVELERFEQLFALSEEESPSYFDLYLRGANTLQRLLGALGLERKAKLISEPPVPTLEQIAREIAEQDAAEIAAQEAEPGATGS